MNDMELNEKQEETEYLETEQEPDGRSIRRRGRWKSGIPCVFLGLFAGVLTRNLVLLADPVRGTIFAGEDWIFMGYFFIIPLILFVVACGTPFYRHKTIILLELLMSLLG